MATTTKTLPGGAPVFTLSAQTVPINAIDRAKIADQNDANLADAVIKLALTNAITDPGDAGAIPVTSSGHVAIVTEAGETRTLAIPSFAGQLLMLDLKTEGEGECTITVAQAIDIYGTTTFAMGANDTVLLVGKYIDADLRWRVVFSSFGAGRQPTIPCRGSLEGLIADPGNAAAIPVTRSGYVPIVTAGSETRTLAAPSFVGQELLLYIKTDGGTCVITVASAINQTGNNTITMAEVRDSIHLRAIESGSNKVWDVVVANGADLNTVP